MKNSPAHSPNFALRSTGAESIIGMRISQRARETRLTGSTTAQRIIRATSTHRTIIIDIFASRCVCVCVCVCQPIISDSCSINRIQLNATLCAPAKKTKNVKCRLCIRIFRLITTAINIPDPPKFAFTRGYRLKILLFIVGEPR